MTARRRLDNSPPACDYTCPPWRQGAQVNGAGWSSLVARWAHNPKVAGSNPAPATNFGDSRPRGSRGFFLLAPTSAYRVGPPAPRTVLAAASGLPRRSAGG